MFQVSTRCRSHMQAPTNGGTSRTLAVKPHEFRVKYQVAATGFISNSDNSLAKLRQFMMPARTCRYRRRAVLGSSPGSLSICQLAERAQNAARGDRIMKHSLLTIASV